MIVRLIDKETGKQVVRDTKEYRLAPATEDESADLILTFPNKEGNDHHAVSKDIHELYIMNDSGETIDCFTWKEPNNFHTSISARDKELTRVGRD